MEVRRACPICLHDNTRFWIHPPASPGPIVRCQECGFVFVNPIQKPRNLISDGPKPEGLPARFLTSSNLNDIPAPWQRGQIASHMRELSAKKKNARQVLRHLERLNKEPGNLLDIGSYCGVFLSVAAEVGWQTFGLEPMVMPAIYSRARFGTRVVTDTLRDDTFPSDTFDVVTAFQVFEHLVEPERELKKIWRILKPNGLLVIEVPNIESWMVKLLKERHRHFVKDHISFYSAHTLNRLLTRLGFRIREVYYPTRSVSVRHLAWWIGKYNAGFGTFADRALPDNLLNKQVGMNLGDIVTVIAEK